VFSVVEMFTSALATVIAVRERVKIDATFLASVVMFFFIMELILASLMVIWSNSEL